MKRLLNKFFCLNPLFSKGDKLKIKSLRAFLLLTVLCPLLAGNWAAAQNLSYEVIRTEQAPGYFALRVYPGDELPPLQVETVFVTNYTTKSEKAQYADLIQAIRNSGAQVLKPHEAAGLVGDDRYRLVLIGGPSQDRWLQFNAENEVIPEFETFSQNKLGPVYLMNLHGEFGGNVSQVRPKTIPYLNDTATYFVGEFERPIKTRVNLQGETDDVIVQADGIMDLSHYQPHPAEGVITQLWHDLSPLNSCPPVKGEEKGVFGCKNFDLKDLVTNSFPFLLGAFGLLLMYFAGRPSKLRTGFMDQVDEFFWHTPVEETPIYGAWEKSIPWELSDEELKLIKIS